jgi:hypothetical protein
MEKADEGQGYQRSPGRGNPSFAAAYGGHRIVRPVLELGFGQAGRLIV